MTKRMWLSRLRFEKLIKMESGDEGECELVPVWNGNVCGMRLMGWQQADVCACGTTHITKKCRPKQAKINLLRKKKTINNAMGNNTNQRQKMEEKRSLRVSRHAQLESDGCGWNETHTHTHTYSHKQTIVQNTTRFIEWRRRYWNETRNQFRRMETGQRKNSRIGWRTQECTQGQLQNDADTEQTNKSINQSIDQIKINNWFQQQRFKQSFRVHIGVKRSGNPTLTGQQYEESSSSWQFASVDVGFSGGEARPSVRSGVWGWMMVASTGDTAQRKWRKRHP